MRTAQPWLFNATCVSSIWQHQEVDLLEQDWSVFEPKTSEFINECSILLGHHTSATSINIRLLKAVSKHGPKYYAVILINYSK